MQPNICACMAQRGTARRSAVRTTERAPRSLATLPHSAMPQLFGKHNEQNRFIFGSAEIKKIKGSGMGEDGLRRDEFSGI